MDNFSLSKNDVHLESKVGEEIEFILIKQNNPVSFVSIFMDLNDAKLLFTTK